MFGVGSNQLRKQPVLRRWSDTLLHVLRLPIMSTHSETDAHQLLTQALETMQAKDRALGAAHTLIENQRGLIIDLLKRLDKPQAAPISPELRAQLSRYRTN